LLSLSRKRKKRQTSEEQQEEEPGEETVAEPEKEEYKEEEEQEFETWDEGPEEEGQEEEKDLEEEQPNVDDEVVSVDAPTENVPSDAEVEADVKEPDKKPMEEGAGDRDKDAAAQGSSPRDREPEHMPEDTRHKVVELLIHQEERYQERDYESAPYIEALERKKRPLKRVICRLPSCRGVLFEIFVDRKAGTTVATHSVRCTHCKTRYDLP
jgi:hypothetical protein